MTSFPELTSLCDDDEEDIATVAWGSTNLWDTHIVESERSILESERRITFAELQAAYQEARARNIASHRAATLRQHLALEQHMQLRQQARWRLFLGWLVFALLVLTGLVGLAVWQLVWRV